MSMKPTVAFTIVFLSTAVAFIVTFIWMATNLLSYANNDSLNPIFHTPASVSGSVSSVLMMLWLGFLMFVELDCKFNVRADNKPKFK